MMIKDYDGLFEGGTRGKDLVIAEYSVPGKGPPRPTPSCLNVVESIIVPPGVHVNNPTSTILAKSPITSESSRSEA